MLFAQRSGSSRPQLCGWFSGGQMCRQILPGPLVLAEGEHDTECFFGDVAMRVECPPALDRLQRAIGQTSRTLLLQSIRRPPETLVVTQQNVVVAAHVLQVIDSGPLP